MTLADLPPRAREEALRQLERQRGVTAVPTLASLPIPEGAKRIASRPRKISILEESWGKELRTMFPEATIHAQFPLAIGNRCNYYIDYLVIEKGEGGVVRVFGHEVKGPYSRDNGITKLKGAARTYPWIKFTLISQAANGGFEKQEVYP
jgi:hypothetical protein